MRASEAASEARTELSAASAGARTRGSAASEAAASQRLYDSAGSGRMAGAASVKSVASVASVVLVLKAAFGGGGEVATAMEAVGNAPEEAAAVDHEGGSEGAAMGLGLFGVGTPPPAAEAGDRAEEVRENDDKVDKDERDGNAPEEADAADQAGRGLNQGGERWGGGGSFFGKKVITSLFSRLRPPPEVP